MTAYTVYAPSYVHAFRCDGKKCNAHCCRGWNITIDDAAYENYEKIKNRVVRNTILRAIERFKPTETFPQGGWHIALKKNGACPMIRPDRLCTIQKALGETALSHTCRVYPRVAHDLEEVQFRTLSMTCPVAAQMALFTDDGMALTERRASGGEHIWDLFHMGGVWSNTYKRKAEDRAAQMTLCILACTSVLLDGRLPLDIRYFHLLLFADRADELLREDAGDAALARLVDVYGSEESLAATASLFSKQCFDAPLYAKTIIHLLNVIGEERSFINLWGLVGRFSAVYGIEDGEMSASALAIRMLESEVAYREGVEGRYQSVIERYAVHEFLHQGFPFAIEGSLLENVMMFILTQKFFRCLFYGITAYHERAMEKKEVIELIGAYSRNIDHNYILRRMIGEVAQSYSQDPLRFASSMLRS